MSFMTIKIVGISISWYVWMCDLLPYITPVRFLLNLWNSIELLHINFYLSTKFTSSQPLFQSKMASTMTATMHPDRVSSIYVTFLIVASIMTAIATISCILRFVQRLSLEFMWDDWCILGALIFAFGFMTTTILVAIIPHAGYHVTEYAVWELNSYLKVYQCSKWGMDRPSWLDLDCIGKQYHL